MSEKPVADDGDGLDEDDMVEEPAAVAPMNPEDEDY